MADAVVFSYEVFQGLYPELAAVPEGSAANYFTMASIAWRNDGTSPNTAPNSQATFMYLLTAHIATLFTQSQGDPSPGSPKDANTPVGRINSATQGSVTVQIELLMGASPADMYVWLAQTKYGLMFWALTGPFRRAVYRLGRLQPGGLPGSGPGWWAVR